MFSNIRVVMVNTSLPANIGAAARALKTMGLGNLVLVDPQVFPSADATALGVRLGVVGDLVDEDLAG